jgi:hypothetical protein
MAYFATVRFFGAVSPTDRLIRIEAGSLLHAALSAEMICRGYTIGSGRKAEVIDLRNYSRAPQNALETTEDFINLNAEIKGDK